jgi:hypothetical protein
LTDNIISIEELGNLIMQREIVICNPFEELIDDLIHEMANSFDSEKEFFDHLFATNGSY